MNMDQIEERLAEEIRNVSAPSRSLELGSRVILARCPDHSVKKEEMFLYLECGHFISRIYSRSNNRITSRVPERLLGKIVNFMGKLIKTPPGKSLSGIKHSFHARCRSETASARGLIYSSHKRDIFRRGAQEIVGSKAGRAEGDPDSGSVDGWRGTRETHQHMDHQPETTMVSQTQKQNVGENKKSFHSERGSRDSKTIRHPTRHRPYALAIQHYLIPQSTARLGLFWVVFQASGAGLYHRDTPPSQWENPVMTSWLFLERQRQQIRFGSTLLRSECTHESQSAFHSHRCGHSSVTSGGSKK
ncbi:unnamed protein product [Pleuronectes platessa]|uniref:Uncharacterized protein n=1 Tax=Pleuronectes platessa TaxID=8262 RepID=A0A9N7Y6Y1_PLEPL|nr:unnamed protein product [Pleuronectes platessa]